MKQYWFNILLNLTTAPAIDTVRAPRPAGGSVSVADIRNTPVCEPDRPQHTHTTENRSPWAGFLLRRATSFLVSLWVIVTLVFFLSRALGGDAVRQTAGINATPEYLANRRAQLGLDDPLLVQYQTFLKRIFTLNFGESISTHESAMALVSDRLPYTSQLGIYAFALTVVIAIPLGMMVAVRSARKSGSAQPVWFHTTTGFLASIPDFLIAIVLIAIFAIGLKLLPPAGGTGFRAFVLPVITLAVGLVATLSRIVATETSRVLQEEYIRAAKSMRISQARLYRKYLLPNVITATITYSGVILANVLGGTIITETVFAWPGIGSLTIQSIQSLDYPVLEATVFIIAMISLGVTFVVDVVLAFIDPASLILRS
ncbi:MAG: ABC transporter permease [Gordonia sp. (in: high G+C Gram-positive bacteria)]